jgi:hypothetical protein
MAQENGTFLVLCNSMKTFSVMVFLFEIFPEES